ncbi:MAG: molybdopterin-dependent oxidoreductase, partial [Gammaproteobacteria bacterium]|nr:molybdopterin-dependent oxidoreductase [Gammaproteobacteria bacterium]
MSDFQRSVCPHDCPSVCALEVEVQANGQIGRVYGAKDHSYTDGVICAKVARYAERANHPDRLTHPMILTGAKGTGLEAYRSASWSEALDLIAARMQSTITQYGAQAIWPYHYAGTMGLVQRDGLDRFRHALGSSRMHATFCTTLPDAGYSVGCGAKKGSDSRLMAQSDLIVVWGGNPVNTQVNVMNYIAKAKRANNAKLVVVDPYRTRTAKKADMHLMLKPGSDGALACATIHVLVRDGLADLDYLAQYTDWDESASEHFAQRSPEWAAPITGLSVADIESFAQLYGNTQKSFLRFGYGFARSRNGATNMHAASCLPAITGAWRYKGGGALYSNGALYSIDRTLIQGLDIPHSHLRILDQSRLGEVLCGNRQDLQQGPPVTVLFTQNTNPAVVAPDTRRVIQGLLRPDLFTVVHEQFFTDTA